eukprot:Selendium_serpulae@DN8504_c0_g1_i1.p1
MTTEFPVPLDLDYHLWTPGPTFVPIPEPRVIYIDVEEDPVFDDATERPASTERRKSYSPEPLPPAPPPPKPENSVQEVRHVKHSTAPRFSSRGQHFSTRGAHFSVHLGSIVVFFARPHVSLVSRTIVRNLQEKEQLRFKEVAVRLI